MTRVPDPHHRHGYPSLPPHPMNPPPYPTMRPQRSALAIASLVLGALAMLGLGPLSGIPAIITGIVGRRRIIDSHGTQTGTTATVLGIVLGVAGTVIVVLAVAWLYLIVLAAGAGEPPRK